MYYLGELARKPYARQEVLGSNPAGCKKNFSVRDILSREAMSRFQNRDKSQFETGTKGRICSSGVQIGESWVYLQPLLVQIFMLFFVN